MRLICPNCGAQYEISDDLIPEDGRDVQCSNCGHTWFQQPASAIQDDTLDEEAAPEDASLSPPTESAEPIPEPKPEPEAEPEEEAVEAPEPEDQEPEQRPLAYDVQSILQEEAAYEEAARKSEAEALEYQQDLGLSGAADDTEREAQARERMARLRGLDPEDPETTPEPPEEPTRKELLPDIDEINSTLKGGLENASVPLSDIVEDPEEPQRQGFRRGFLIAIIIALVLALIYIYAPQISETVPALSGALEGYAGGVDQLRLNIDSQLRSATDSMGGNGG